MLLSYSGAVEASLRSPSTSSSYGSTAGTKLLLLLLTLVVLPPKLFHLPVNLRYIRIHINHASCKHLKCGSLILTPPHCPHT